VATNPTAQIALGTAFRNKRGLLCSAFVAKAFTGAKLVKGFNHPIPATLAADPIVEGGHRVVFLSTDGEDATVLVAALAKQLGFAPVKLGKLNEGGWLVHAAALGASSSSRICSERRDPKPNICYRSDGALWAWSTVRRSGPGAAVVGCRQHVRPTSNSGHLRPGLLSAPASRSFRRLAQVPLGRLSRITPTVARSKASFAVAGVRHGESCQRAMVHAPPVTIASFGGGRLVSGTGSCCARKSTVARPARRTVGHITKRP